MRNKQMLQGATRKRKILSPEDKDSMRADWNSGVFTYELLAVKYGCSWRAVQDVIKGRWKPSEDSAA